MKPVKPLHEALAELGREHGLKIARAQLETEDGVTHRIELPIVCDGPPSAWTFTNIAATYRGRQFPVTGKKLLILKALALARGEPVSKVDLLRAGWGNEPPDDPTFRQTIYQLRQLILRELRPDRDPIEDAGGSYILTIY